ncbi:hypothetical protein [Cellulomonas sp.]|uniref:hypothetical protein n=1 Tax=Cellulomonas sp. TaxID=40001 RepID=UPI001B242723|nr:hypothetical protein [Cellulomonas sp.]MBO9555261.1 hypothetical protein [Cellulomonas sp.]
MARDVRGGADDEWGWFDAALLYTCHVVAATKAGRTDAITTTVAASFPPAMARDESLLSEGWFVLQEFFAPGDGTYQHDGGFFFASGGLGLAVTGVVAGVRAAGNASRRQAAAAAAVPRWLEVDRGSVVVSSHGFYLQSTKGHRQWPWESVQVAEMVGPDVVQLYGHSTTGPVLWRLQSPWAPMVFGLWCVDRHPQHPQFVANDWLPRGWWERATAAGHRPAIGWSQG